MQCYYINCKLINMHINTNCENFIPKNFVILNFYGKNTCIAWNQNEFICFPYIFKKSTEKLQVLKAPAIIKDIRSFSEKVFILCLPAGIYKLTDNFECFTINEMGFEFGSNFYEVLILKDDTLCLENKKRKITKSLFSISTTSNLYIFTLNYENTDNTFYNLFLPDNYNSNINLCFISKDKQLFKLLDQRIHIIYNCDYLIKEIKPVEKHKKIYGLLLATDTNIVVLIHVVDNKLKYDKIFLETDVQIVTAVMDINIENELMIIYSDNIRTYYSRKILIADSVQEVRIEEKYYENFKIYKSKYVIYLNNSKELFQISIEQLKNGYYQNTNDYIKLESYMLKDLDKIIETICDKTIELKKLRDKTIKKEDRYKRINLFVNKQNTKFDSDDYVKKILNQIFLISNFKNALPKNCTVCKMLKSKGKTIFSMKNVKDYDTIIEMPIYISKLSSKLNIRTDLITYKYDKGIWCLIKNYIQNPILSKSKKLYITTDKLHFIQYKLTVLQNLIKSKNLSLATISKIKKDVRREIQS